MATKETLRIAQNQKTATCGMSDTTPELPEALRRLLSKMESGVHPDFLDVMAGISEMVAFYTDCDSDADLEEIEKFFMSQKKCRFCP